MEPVYPLRIIVASPGDVQAERNALPAVIEELNRNIASTQGLRLELGRWEMDTYPGFHPEGPQGLIDSILHIEDCDVLLGIFWKRFGTPTKEAGSGPEHEFLRAYAAWKQHGRPQIMVYFNLRDPKLRSTAEHAQYGQVLQFKERFPEEGLWWTYNGKTQFERLVRNHLTQFLRQRGHTAPAAPHTPPRHDTPVSVQQHGSGGIAIGPGAVVAGAGGMAVGGHFYGDVHLGTATAPEPTDDLRDAYLTWLMDQVRAVLLTGVDPKSIREETRRDLDLAAVYTALRTQRTDMAEERTLRPDREAQRLSALAVLNTEPHLALLGDPGSGKSTFINFVALCMAGELCHHPDANLRVLTAPMPADDDASRRRREEEPQLQPWEHGALLPMRVVLREFVARGLPHTSQPAPVGGDSLWRFMTAELPETLRSFESSLRQQLLRTGGLLLLDGLDEVPEADQRRVQVKTAVEQFAAAFPKMRVLVTSRTYAYQRQDWKLRGFAEAVLAPFSEAQMHRFVDRWYAYVGQARRLSADDTQGHATLLKQAIARTPRLHELATRPLLLTLMASLHAWRGGTLPEQREALYADAVDLLLDQWESQKVRRLPDGTYDLIQPSLVEWLRVDQQAMRQALNRLAFEVHRDQPAMVGTADIAEEKLVPALLALARHPDPDIRPARLIEYLRDRAGLLEPRGVGVYAFPHRTFQEYLAACYLTDVGFPDDLAALLRAEPNRWREVTLLAGAKAVRGTAAAAWTLAEALCFEAPPTQPLPADAGYWAALLATQVLIENKSLAQVAERNRPKVERIRTWLVRTLQHNALLAVDRAQAGDALADIGDLRFRADAWYLPDEPLLGFVEIPGGPFLMGSNDERDSLFLKASPQHKVTLPTYYIARYPVTVAQFRAFVDASGHPPADKDSLDGSLNHPVVWVSWHDAIAYCHWLTARLREWSDISEPLATLLCTEGWRVILPSEAEWEKAARGIDGRAYPWGNEPDPNRANYDETGINTTSAVGCFPQDASLYDVEELSGNVWEWTRSLEGDYPYPVRRAARAKREDLQAPEDASRVLRGGAFWNDHQNVRCAYRNRNDARNVNNNIGFRVALAGPTYCYVSTARRGFRTLPGRDAIWQSLFLAAPELSQAGHIATALHPGSSALVRGSHVDTSMYAQLTSWDNLLLAYRRASKGKRSQPGVAAFEYRLEEHLLALQEALRTHTYRPGTYTHFFIHEPKRRLISAAPFRDRVVHHALCNLIEPVFERTFVADSYANRLGKGTHCALQRVQDLARQYPYVLQCDLRQFFPSVDHAILRDILARKLTDGDVLWLIDRILESGRGVLSEVYTMAYFPGDDLFAALRPRGLPIGNLTSQFWANVYLNPFDHFAKRTLRCQGYVRYVDDMLFFATEPATLWTWKTVIQERLATLRLTIHPGAHPRPVTEGIPVLGFVVFPQRRRLKRRKGIYFRRRLAHLMAAWHADAMPLPQVTASVQGWVNHVRYGNTVGLRKAVLWHAGRRPRSVPLSPGREPLDG